MLFSVARSDHKPSDESSPPGTPSFPSKSADAVSAHLRAETVRRTADIGGGVRKYENYDGVSGVRGVCSVLDKLGIDRSNLTAFRLQTTNVVGWDMVVGGCGVGDLDSALGKPNAGGYVG